MEQEKENMVMENKETWRVMKKSKVESERIENGGVTECFQKWFLGMSVPWSVTLTFFLKTTLLSYNLPHLKFTSCK